jgi:riboflavin kinase/FMN adenylyltransferase
MINNNITSIAIGGFDGMHQAHQQLFLKLTPNSSAIVVIQTPYANLTPNSRQNYTTYPIYYYDLEDIKHLSSDQFVSLLLEKFPNLNKIIIGYDFAFGKGASCDIQCLKNTFKGEVIVVDEYKVDDISVHSRSIREALNEANLSLANQLLGYNYTLYGTHIKGQGIGSKELVPTINLEVKEYLIPKAGVYKTNTILEDKIYKSITFIGHRITTDGSFAVETHILDKKYDGKVTKKIAIEFISFIRKNQRFNTFQELKEQIKKDIFSTY